MQPKEMETPQEIASLIARRILGDKLTDEENAQLDQWLETSTQNQQTYQNVEETDLVEQIWLLEKSGYGSRMAERFEKERLQSSHRRLWKHTFIAIGTAACILLAVLFRFSEHTSQPAQSPTPVSLIQPGSTAAILTLADGRQFDMQSTNPDSLHTLLQQVAQADALKEADKIAYHELSVPAGGEFQYVLPDGTKVWLNSKSNLRFPENFDKEGRHVYLKGEAFFDVTKDTRTPFTVTTSGGDIRVYGTRFNVTDYDQEDFSAVLVSGSIEYQSPHGKSVRLRPSQRVVYHTQYDHIDVQEVDTLIYTSWINHQFIFKGETLENIMNTLSRWYDFTPVFQSDEIRHIRLSGRLNRQEDIRILLQSYEASTGIKFRINQKEIIITQ